MRPMTRPSPAAWLAALLLTAVTGAVHPAGAEKTPEAFATGFARGFFAGEYEKILKLATPAVRAAMTAEQSEKLRATLVEQNGELKRVGSAWHEDDVQGFHRYRVPLEFAGATLDMRVVLDGEGRVAGLFFVPHSDPPEKGDDEPPVEETEISVGEPALPGTLSIPDGSGPFPAVVLVHGSGPNDRDETIGLNKPFRELAWGLARRGVMVLRYDKRSFARPGDLIAVGDGLTVQQEVIDDARAALQLLRRRKQVDPARLFVLGHSLGGTLAPRIAGEEPRPAGIIVLAGGTLPLPEKMLEQTRYILEATGNTSGAARQQLEQIEQAVETVRSALDGETEDPAGNVLGVPVGYYRDLKAHDPPAEAARLGLPTLVLQGKRDYQVTMEDFARWQRGLTDQPGACLHAYDELDHLFRRGEGPSTPLDYDRRAPVDERVVRDIAAWVLTGRCPA